ncbi:hypothetical protein Taro_025150 [Colocasia esculenta]|uniref:Uncharacterized protein n=1 Tax=Colocasia esculenta TaxID=4460 RepID=A0A843V2I3_COLES|nr:hypothetical protein [Colocasia esculenta]
MDEVAEKDRAGTIDLHKYHTSMYEEGDARSTLNVIGRGGGDLTAAALTNLSTPPQRGRETCTHKSGRIETPFVRGGTQVRRNTGGERVQRQEEIFTTGEVEESGTLRNDEMQNLLVGAECKANQISDKLNKVNGFATNAEDTQRNERNESKPRNGILAVDHIATSSLVSQCNEWPSSLHGLLNQAYNLRDSAAVSFPSQDQIVDSSTYKNSSSTTKNVEGTVLNINEEGYHMKAQTTEQDGPEALWVKWGTMTAILCCTPKKLLLCECHATSSSLTTLTSSSALTTVTTSTSTVTTTVTTSI